MLVSSSFHNKLKTNPKYLNHKVNRRCDDLIAVLLHYEQDMFCERMRKELIMSPSNASEKVEGNKWHMSAALVANSSVQITTSTLMLYTNLYFVTFHTGMYKGRVEGPGK